MAENNNLSRSEYVAKNASITLVMQIIQNLLGFIGRTIFVKVLGAEYLGVNGLFTEILNVLSFAELGIGSAMIFSLYKPLAEKDEEKIKSLMHLYAKSYQVIGFMIAGLGLCVTPFLKYLIGDVSYVKENLTLLYLLFLLNSVISYFFVYKKSLIIANQKNYLVDIYQQVFYAIQVAIQLIILLVTKEYITYLIIAVLITFLNNLWVGKKAEILYPYLKDNNIKPLEKAEKESLFTNIKALVVYKVGGIILESTGSIFISALINVLTVGLYSNYKLIINIFKTIGSQVMNSVIASVGNLNASEDNERKEAVFMELFYINAWFYGFTSVGLCLLLSRLVNVWIGVDYIIGMDSVIAAVIYYYVANMHYPCYTYRTTAGLFVFGRYVPLIAAIINVILVFILGISFGLSGILWASTIARVVTYEIIDPIMIYKRVFHKNTMIYFLMYLKYVVLISCIGFLCNLVIHLIPLQGVGGLLLNGIIISIIFNVLFFMVTVKTSSFNALKQRFRNIMKKVTRVSK